MKPARHLDRAFDRFRARIGKEHRVGESGRDQPLRQPFLTGNRDRDSRCARAPPPVAAMRGYQMGMAVAQQRDCDAGPEVEIAPAFFVEKVSSLASDECNVRPVHRSEEPAESRKSLLARKMKARLIRACSRNQKPEVQPGTVFCANGRKPVQHTARSPMPSEEIRILLVFPMKVL